MLRIVSEQPGAGGAQTRVLSPRPVEPGETMLDEELVAAPADADPVTEHLARGQALGRYILLEPLGEGGMGVVYAAYDPELDRRVALKLLRHGAADDSSMGRARLVREAQAMAKLSHPNVITVFDVGAVEGRVFVSMELVVGDDLRGWLAAAARTPAEILRVFVQAGRGLAAAHAAGLIHRDFKPGNVLVGEDGTVRVADFGLARRLGEREGSDDGQALVATPVEGTPEAVTRTGAVIGTPAYMAPEQHLGRDLDARADQFSFCVALWEALQGERPFRATHPVELMVQVTRGEIMPSAKDGAMPAWIRRVLARGLAPDPAQRFASMTELLAALDRDPRRRRLAVGSVAGIATLGAVAWLAVAPEEPCAGAERQLAEVWSPARRDQLSERFAATGLPYAADAAASVGRRLDAYGAAWIEARVKACAAALADPQADVPEDVPMSRCVERRRRDLGALVDVLVDADAALVERASEALGGLRALETCFDPALGFGDVPLPADPDARAAVEAARDALGRVNAASLAGRRREALELSTEVWGEAVRLGDVALLAEASLIQGGALADQGRFDEGVAQLEAGAIWAIQSGYDMALLELWIALAWHTGVDLGRYDVAAAWARQADAMLVRLGRPLRQLGNLRAAQSAFASVAGRPEEALAAGRESLEVRLRDQPGEPILANTLLEIANPLVALGRYDEATVVLEQALAIAIETDGPDHPIVSAIENTMGVRDHFAGDSRSAEVHWRRAYAIMEAALGPDHPELFYSLGNLSEAMRDQGKFDEALETLQRVAALQRSLPPIHRERATTMHNIAGVQLRRGQLEAARAGFREALAMREAVFGPDDPAVANTLTELSDVLLELGRADEARPLLERAQVIRDAAPSSRLELAYTQVMLGRARIATGDAGGRALVQQADASLAELRGNTRDRLRRVAADVLGSGP